MDKITKKWATWLLTNGIFAISLYGWAVYDNETAKNVSLFMAWFAFWTAAIVFFAIKLIVMMGTKLAKERADGTLIKRSIELSHRIGDAARMIFITRELAFDIPVLLVLIHLGAYLTSIAYALQIYFLVCIWTFGRAEGRAFKELTGGEKHDDK